MAEQPTPEFGKRKPPALRTPVIPTAQPVKRSNHVALLLMGSLAVGGGAYALMPSENCGPSAPGMTQTNTDCPPRNSSSSHGLYGSSWSRSSLFSSDASASRSGGSPESGSANVTRGGFGGFTTNAFAAHFSGGG